MLGMDSFLSIQAHMPGYADCWLYTDNGIPVMCVARYDTLDGKTFRQFVPEHGEWIEGMCRAPYPLYGLSSLPNPLVLDAVMITEGEKACSLLHQLKWPAVSTVLGASHPDRSDWSPLRHFTRFIVLRDNDEASIRFVRSVTCELRRHNADCEISVVNLCRNIKGGDLVDWAQQTVLLGSEWDGYSRLGEESLQRIALALRLEITKAMVTVEGCPEVAFKPLEAQFPPNPRPLDIKLLPVPPFPLHVLPKPVANLVTILSLQMSQVPDFAATIFLLAIAGLIGRLVQLRMRPGTTWIEVANAWGAIVGSPASKKSPIMRALLQYFRLLEDRAAEEYRGALRAYKAREKEAKENKEIFDEEPPVRRRYITDDTTMPKLREILSDNSRGILMRNDELKGQLERLDKAGSEGDRSFLMSCWSGLEFYTEDRMCRESNINIPLAVTWAGCIPPPALQRYLREAMGQGSGADGFMQRFQFVCYPDTVKRYTLSNETQSEELQKIIQDYFITLDNQARDPERTLSFSQEAQQRFDQWLIEHETNARSGEHPIYWESHLGKQAKALAVACIVLHRLHEVSENVELDEVSLATLENALELQKYYEAHARRCYESISGAIVDDALTILRLLKEKRIDPRFKAQDVYRNGKGGLQDPQRVKAALELLVEYGWLVSEKTPAGPHGGRQHEFWNLHPRAFESE